VHGSAKLDWVTEWFFEMNWKAITSSCFAVTLSGTKVNPPPSPTLTTIVSAQTQAARPKKAETMAAKRMSRTEKKRKKDVERLVVVARIGGFSGADRSSAARRILFAQRE